MELTEEELGLRYQTFCDPRLNFEQSLGKTCFPGLQKLALRKAYLDVAFLISNWFKKQRKSATGEKDVLSSALVGGA